MRRTERNGKKEKVNGVAKIAGGMVLVAAPIFLIEIKMNPITLKIVVAGQDSLQEELSATSSVVNMTNGVEANLIDKGLLLPSSSIYSKS